MNRTRTYLLSTAAALAILATGGGAAIAQTAPDAPVTPDPAPEAAPADVVTVDTSPPRRRGIDHEHSLGAGYHALVFRTESSDRYTVQGPAIAYSYFVGRQWGFLLRLAAFFPLLGSMSGPSGEFSGSLVEIYDQHRYGLDSHLMVAHRYPVRDRIELTVATGAHVQFLSLAGLEYSPVEVVTLGIGGLGKLDYDLNSWLSISTQLAVAVDLFDPVDHMNAADVAVPLSWTFAIDARH